MAKLRVASFHAVACDAMAALSCAHLLVAHDHTSCDRPPHGLSVCSESRTLSSSIFDDAIATNVVPSLLCEAAFAPAALTASILVEWFLSASHRVLPAMLLELKPDLIITQLPEGVSAETMEAALETVARSRVRVVCIDARCQFGEVWEATIMRIARELARASASELLLSDAKRIISRLEQRVEVVTGMCAGRRSVRESNAVLLCLRWDEQSKLLQRTEQAMGTWVSDMVKLIGGEMEHHPEDEEKQQQQMGFICVDDLVSSSLTKPDSAVLLRKRIVILTDPRRELGQMRELVLSDRRFDGLVQAAATCPHLLRLVIAHGPRFLSRPSPFVLVESLEALCEILHPESQPFGHVGSLWCTLEEAEPTT